jgi:NDP-sugar pyrophosphorylase family protein
MKPAYDLRALILAAGMGSRLGALSDERPKPLLPVCDTPLIRYAIELLRGHGITAIAINLHHHGSLIEKELGDGRELGVHITYSHEDALLGTGGPLKRLQRFLTHEGRQPCLVVNGKILIDVNLHAVVERHVSTGALATMVLKAGAANGVPANVEVSAQGSVTRILNAGTAGLHQCVFTGVHVLSPRFIQRLPDGVSDSVRQGYVPALLQHEHIQGFLIDDYFFEHSTPERYLQGNFNALDGTAHLKHPPGPLRGISPLAHLEPTARIEGPVLIGDDAHIAKDAVIGPYVVIGHDSFVGPGARLSHSVIWPGSWVRGEHHREIITPTSTLSVL